VAAVTNAHSSSLCLYRRRGRIVLAWIAVLAAAAIGGPDGVAKTARIITAAAAINVTDSNETRR
jgi:hypothetical protein